MFLRCIIYSKIPVGIYLNDCYTYKPLIYYKGRSYVSLYVLILGETMSQVFKQDLTDNSVCTVIDINLGEYASGTR